MTSIKIKILPITPELIFVLYFWGFMLLRPILKIVGNFSVIVLFFYVLTLFVLLSVKYTKINLNNNIIVLILLVLSVFLFDLIFRRNDVTISYLYEFIIYGGIPMYFLSLVKDTRLLLEYFCKLSLIAFLMLGWSPLAEYTFFNDYMDYGFNLVLPAYFGFYIGWKYFKKKFFLLFQILSFVSILFSSRSVLLSVILFHVIVFFFSKISLIKKILIVSFVSLAILILFRNRVFIITSLREYIESLGFYSYTVHRLYQSVITGNLLSGFSSRRELWDIAKNLLTHWNTFIFGKGTGFFQSTYGTYPHNLYFDIMIQYGILGVGVIFMFILNSLICVYYRQGYNRILGLIFLCLWFPKLMLSLYFFKEISIWCFIAYGLIPLNFNDKKT